MEIYKKLSEFQNEVKPIKKDGLVSFGKIRFKYATLENITDVIRPLLTEKGLMYFFFLSDNKITVRLVDLESGDKIESTIKLPETSDPKVTGSNITYFKRYLLTSVLGIVTDDDTSEAKAKVKPSLTEQQYNQAIDKIRNGEKGVIHKLKAYFTLTEDQENNLNLIEVTENE